MIITQLDQDILAELPLDIQREIQAECKKHPKPLPKPAIKTVSNKSPRKKPRKSKTTSLVNNSRYHTPSQPTLKGLVKKTNEKKADLISPPKIDQEIKPQQSKPKITICGAETEIEVKLLLNEWVKSTDEPENEDFARLENYLVELLNHKNMELVYKLLVYLKR